MAINDDTKLYGTNKKILKNKFGIRTIEWSAGIRTIEWSAGIRTIEWSAGIRTIEWSAIEVFIS